MQPGKREKNKEATENDKDEAKFMAKVEDFSVSFQPITMVMG